MMERQQHTGSKIRAHRLLQEGYTAVCTGTLLYRSTTYIQDNNSRKINYSCACCATEDPCVSTRDNSSSSSTRYTAVYIIHVGMYDENICDTEQRRMPLCWACYPISYMLQPGITTSPAFWMPAVPVRGT